MAPPPKSVAVVGAGLSGLTTAYRLATRTGARVTLLDSSSRAGGWATSKRYPLSFEHDGVKHVGEVVLEFGPRSIRPRGGPGAPRMLQLVSSPLHPMLTTDQRPRTSGAHHRDP